MFARAASVSTGQRVVTRRDRREATAGSDDGGSDYGGEAVREWIRSVPARGDLEMIVKAEDVRAHYPPEHPTCGIPPSGRKIPSGVSRSYSTVLASDRSSVRVKLMEWESGLLSSLQSDEKRTNYCCSTTGWSALSSLSSNSGVGLTDPDCSWI
jgi:hypothetical protein